MNLMTKKLYCMYQIKKIICLNFIGFFLGVVTEKKSASTSHKTASGATHEPKDGESMDVECKSQFNSRTKKDEHGQYPAWMTQRAIRKLKRGNKSKKSNKGNKKGVLSW